MYGATRTTATLAGVALAGLLLWLGDSVLDPDDSPGTWAYWGWAGLCALAGLALALSQVAGGWTKWGWPRLSRPVVLGAFLPVLLVGGWIVAAFDPSASWLQEHVADWSEDIGVDGVVNDLGGAILNVSAIALVIGLVLGFSVDTTGPRPVREVGVHDERVAPEAPAVAGAGFAEQAEARREAADAEARAAAAAAETRVVRDEPADEETRIVEPHAGADEDDETRVVRPDPPPER